MVDYKFYNANPLGKIESDCVCRAICRAVQLPYEEIELKLELIAELFECEKLCVCCYHHLLEKVFGLIQRVALGETVEELAFKFKDNVLLMRLDGHLTVAEFGTVYDLWDCRDEKVDVFWVVE